MLFLTQIGYLGVVTDRFSSLKELDEKITNNALTIGSINTKNILEQWDKYKPQCHNHLEMKGWFIFHALDPDTEEVIAVITGS
jgi:hypothetical protein